MDDASAREGLDRLILRAASDGVFAVDVVEDRILTANPAFLTMTGHAETDLVDGPMSLLIPAPGIESESRDFCAKMLAYPGPREVRLRRADGLACEAVMNVTLPAARPSVALCYVRDVRWHWELEPKTAEAALAELEKRDLELAQLSSRLALVSKRAALADLCAGVAHGLNSPLAAVLSSARVLRALVADGANNDVQRERGLRICDRIQEQGARMESIITELRLACRSGERRSAPIEMGVAGEVRAVLALFGHRLAHDVTVVQQIEDVPPVVAAPDDFHHVVCNLIDNALRAMDGRGRLWVELRSLESEVELAVEDDGPGVPAEVARRLFEPFVSRSRGGAGVGLAISSRLVKAWGGRIRLERGRVGGARFVVSLCVKEGRCQRAAS